jgi:hypothetical protein
MSTEIISIYIVEGQFKISLSLKDYSGLPLAYLFYGSSYFFCYFLTTWSICWKLFSFLTTVNCQLLLVLLLVEGSELREWLFIATCACLPQHTTLLLYLLYMNPWWTIYLWATTRHLSKLNLRERTVVPFSHWREIFYLGSIVICSP